MIANNPGSSKRFPVWAKDVEPEKDGGAAGEGRGSDEQRRIRVGGSVAQDDEGRGGDRRRD